MDVVALGTIVGTAWGHLPEFAAVMGGIWYLIQIVDYFYYKWKGNGRKDDQT